MGRKIILFELNEVPLRIIDQYCRWRPNSTIARRMPRMRQFETVTQDIGHLSPWITWPTFHRGVIDQQHMIHHFGQDLSDVDKEFPPVWELLRRNGVSVGICGTLHTYPMPSNLEGYKFFIPDTFAAGSECFPQKLSLFQEFNLTMARESARNVSSHIPWQPALKFLAAAPGLGLKPKTFMDLGLQLLSERQKRWMKVRRRTHQSSLAFDVFMKQLETTRPEFTSYFTNHVASSMHRYWAAAFPDDYEINQYDEEWIQTYAREIEYTMSKADEYLTRLFRFVDRNPEYQLWIASSMGQAATIALPLETQLYIHNREAFMDALGIPRSAWEMRPAMLPQFNFKVASDQRAAFREALDAIEVDGDPIDYDERENGFFMVNFGQKNLHDRPDAVRFQGRVVRPEELGLKHVEIEDKSDSNAYHIPEGSLLIYDPTSPNQAAQGRQSISTLEFAPTLLRNFGVESPDYMTRPAQLANAS